MKNSGIATNGAHSFTLGGVHQNGDDQTKGHGEL
jgi:hypothetical protein